MTIKKNIFFLKFYKFIFNNFFNETNFYNKYNNITLQIFIKYNLYKFYITFLFNFFNNYNKMLIFDSHYKNSYSFLSNLYDIKDLYNYNTFFFPNPIFFTKKN